MPTNEFKAFAIGVNANVITQVQYEALPALGTGFAAGIAYSAQVNKPVRQATTAAAALAEAIMTMDGADVDDDGDYQALAQRLLAGIANMAYTTGDLKPTFKAAADSGWVILIEGQTIGASTSSATVKGETTRALYNLIWNNVHVSYCPVYTPGTTTPTSKGATADADFNANKPLLLPNAAGRALGAAGNGSGLTPRGLGQILGEELHLLTEPEMPIHGHPYRASLKNESSASSQTSGGFLHSTGNVSSRGPYTGWPDNSIGIGGKGFDQPHNNMQPTMFVNWMMKL